MYKLITPYTEDFGRSNVIIKHFPDTESYVSIPQINALKNKKVTIYHKLYPEPEKRIFELVLILSKVKKKTKNIDLFIPYLPYARQDKENKVGEVVSADVLCGLLKSYGVKKLITYDCHFLPKPGNFIRAGLKIENRSAGKQLLTYAKKYFSRNNKQEKFVVISPDQGASYFTANAQGYFLEKVRKEARATGTKNGIHAKIHKIEGHADVKGKNVCILDDIISTGSTIIYAIKHLKSLGARKIIVGATHGVFAGDPSERPKSSGRAGKIAEKILKNGCSELFTTNAIPSNNKLVKILKLSKN